ncbi:alpha/beta hydrolase [Umboniibacter marinipuniceus]|uniref:Serine aminopeptidase S33 domain-containing protein n=1 Tax=Umboniibacter marinipuniceus TaxID=569599 RepID=A0A3M0A3D5_9GAMM|nr:alpha/beta hydrolase [Umboniibacter marinipuniceus]RMA79493.1 hypothetical protein DFR27_1934 [Umboniibacter marinipuniceus]
MNNLFSQKSHTFFIDGPEGKLEAVIDGCPNAIRGVAIVCHPHPLYAGTMHNKVAHTLARAYRDSGIAAVRFNFRGIGDSDGSYGDGDGELEDLLAVNRWVEAHRGDLAKYLSGFSFGSMVAARGAEACQPKHLCLVAPPAARYPYPFHYPCPVLLLQGTADEVCDAEDAFEWARNTTPAPAVEIFEGGSHFFHGILADFKRRVMKHLETV